ncbi:hypothetical protein [Paludisphaera soli]|uniref:hypothetical protein n=1 Tax=Paludisphaera soli TaxID=2712865 RepID=UPI0013EA28AB|nr:hypothetical protein [Paludisphaera soli]
MSEVSCNVTLPIVRPAIKPEVRRSLPELVTDLLGCLSSVRSRKGSDPSKRSVHRYRDQDFNYLEVALPGLEGVEADICIHEGCIYIRVLR